MAKEIKTQVVINANPDKVWSVLTDFENYPKWNPFIKSITGNIRIGSQITVNIAPPNGKGMTFKPTVLAYSPNKEFRWIGKLLFKGLFDGEHKFELIENANGTTTFVHSEKFKGILVELFKKQLENNTKKGFEMMNEDLKNYAVSRIFLDNFNHIKAYWPMIGRSTAQLSMAFGVDDLDGTIDDTTKIYSMAGAEEQNPSLTTSQLVELIKQGGRSPIERDTLYNVVNDYSESTATI